MAAELAACTRPGPIPAAESRAAPSRSRSTCRAVAGDVASSAEERLANVPTTRSPRSRAERFDGGVEVLGSEARAPHPGVELEVRADRRIELPRGRGQVPELADGVERRRQGVRAQKRQVGRLGMGQHEDLSPDSRSPQAHALLGLGDGETVGALAERAAGRPPPRHARTRRP